MKVGYVRVSKPEQDLSYQIEDVIKAGCSENMIFRDKASGRKMNRPDYDRLLTYLREGDFVVVWKMDRLGRTFNEAVGSMADLERRGIYIISTTEGVDTSTPMGKIMAKFLLLVAEMEVSFNRERTRRALEERRKRGLHGGRPRHPFFSDPKRFATFKAAYDRKDQTMPDLLHSFGLRPSDKYSFYRYQKIYGATATT